MAENDRASDADDLEEGEIPSSEDEDGPKGAETANELAEDTKEDRRDNAHEEPKESRKRHRDASPELDASNRTPDQPKKSKLDESGDTSDLEDGEIFSDDEEAAYYPQLVKSREEEKVTNASSPSPPKSSYSRSRSRSKSRSRSRSPRLRDDWGLSHYRDRQSSSDRGIGGGGSSGSSHGDYRRSRASGRGHSPRPHHRSPHLHSSPRLSRKGRSESSMSSSSGSGSGGSGSKSKGGGKSRLVGEPIRHDRGGGGSAGGSSGRGKWDDLSAQSGGRGGKSGGGANQSLTLSTLNSRLRQGLAILPTPKGNALFSLDEFNYPAPPNWYQKAITNYKKKHSRWNQPQQPLPQPQQQQQQQQVQAQPMAGHFSPPQQQPGQGPGPPLPYPQQQQQQQQGLQPAVLQPQPLVYQHSPPSMVPPYVHQPMPQAQPSPYAQPSPQQHQQALYQQQQQGMPPYLGQPPLQGQPLLGQSLPGQPLLGQPHSYIQPSPIPYHQQQRQQSGGPPYYQSPSASVGAYDAQAFAGRESVGVTPITQTADPTPLFPTGSLHSPPKSPTKPDDDEPGKLILESVSDSDSLDGSGERELEIESSSQNSQDAESPIHVSKSSAAKPPDHTQPPKKEASSVPHDNAEAGASESTEDSDASSQETVSRQKPAADEKPAEPPIQEGPVTRSKLHQAQQAQAQVATAVAAGAEAKPLVVSIPLDLVRMDSSGDIDMASNDDEFNYDDYLDQLNDEEDEDAAPSAMLGEIAESVGKETGVSSPSEEKPLGVSLSNHLLWADAATSTPNNAKADSVDGPNPLDEDFPSVGPFEKEKKKKKDAFELVREDSGDATLCSLISQDSIDDAIAGEEGKEVRTRGKKSARRKQKDRKFWEQQENMAQQKQQQEQQQQYQQQQHQQQQNHQQQQQYQQQYQQQQHQQQHVAGHTPMHHPPTSQPRQPCKYYINGYCLHGDKCQYSHDTPRTKRKEVCKFYLQDACEKGDDCIYHHGSFPCRYHHIKHMCYHGNSCKFSHAPLTPQTRELLLASIEPSLHHLVPPVAMIPGPGAPPTHMTPPAGSVMSPVHQIPPPIGHAPGMGVPPQPQQPPMHNDGGYAVPGSGGMKRFPDQGMPANSGGILSSPPHHQAPPAWQEQGACPPGQAGYSSAPPIQPHPQLPPWPRGNMSHPPPAYPNGPHRSVHPPQNQPGILGPAPWSDVNHSPNPQLSPPASGPHPPPHPNPTSQQPSKSKTVAMPPPPAPKPAHPEVTCNVDLPPSFNVDTLFPDPHPQVLPHNLAIQLRKVLLPTPPSSDKTEEPSYELEFWENEEKEQPSPESQSHAGRQPHSGSQQSGPHQEMSSHSPRLPGLHHISRQKHPSYGTPPPRDLPHDSEFYGNRGPQNVNQVQSAPDPRQGSNDPRFSRAKPPALHRPMQPQQLPAPTIPQGIVHDAPPPQGKAGFQETLRGNQSVPPVWGSTTSSAASSSSQLKGGLAPSRSPSMMETRRAVDPRQKYSHLKIRPRTQQQPGGAHSSHPAPPALKKPGDQDPRQKFKLPSLLQNPPPQLEKPMDPKDLFSNPKDIRENLSFFGSVKQQFGTPPPVSPMNKEKQGFGEIRLNRESGMKSSDDEKSSTAEPTEGESASPDAKDGQSSSDMKEPSFVPSYLRNMDLGLDSDKDSSSNLKIDSAFGSLQARQRRLSDLTSSNHSEESQELINDASSSPKIGKMFSFGSSYF